MDLMELVMRMCFICYVLNVLSAQANIHHPSHKKALHIQDGCPDSPCHCDFQQKIVSCSRLGISHIPQDLPSDTISLDLSGNDLEAVRDDLDRYTHLSHLNLSHNHLTEVSLQAFLHNKKLNQLDLRGNLLGKRSALWFLCALPDSLTTMYLSHNNLQSAALFTLTVCDPLPIHYLDLASNNISAIPHQFLQIFPKLATLILRDNSLSEISFEQDAIPHPLEVLDLSGNMINQINCSGMMNMPDLDILDYGYNTLGEIPRDMCSKNFQRLTHLVLSGNPFSSLSATVFSNLTNLQVLSLSHLYNLTYLNTNTFMGLVNLLELDLSHNINLESIHANAFSGLNSLKTLDLGYCELSWLHKDTITNLTSLEIINLVNNPWHCDCDLKWLPRWLEQIPNLNHTFLPRDITCNSPAHLAGQSIFNATLTEMLECHGPVIVTINVTLWFRIGSQALLDCETESPFSRPRITWVTPKKQVLVFHPAHSDLSVLDPMDNHYHQDHQWHNSRSYYHRLKHPDRITVLNNGSLYIDYVTRLDAGNYTCIVDNGYGNDSAIVMVMLDYSILKMVKLWSMLWGTVGAAGFFIVAVSISSIRYLAIQCSTKERRKKKSIREVLNSLQDFKTVQIDRLCAYKTAKLNKLSAFKNAKLHKLVAFKTAKIDKLRNYKQVTMGSIFHHLERMREHYNCQMNKVKEKSSQQVEKLRENYGNHIGKFKDYRSEKIEKIKDNYSNQMLKIKEYRSFQMNRLRDQYKLQQQHIMKLMELLDIGNCLNVVEAECMRTESMIFDPNISFDLEAQPVHVQRDLASSDDSEYLTAGSLSDSSDADCTYKISDDSIPNKDVKHHKRTANTKKKWRGRKKQQKKDKALHYSNHTPGHTRGDSSSSYSSTGTEINLPVASSQDPANLEPPPPPNFSCDIPELDNLPLEEVANHVKNAQLFGHLQLDEVDLYKTPPTSTHYGLQSSLLTRPQHFRSESDTTSADYESVQQSREQSPDSVNPGERTLTSTEPDHDSHTVTIIPESVNPQAGCLAQRSTQDELDKPPEKPSKYGLIV